MKMAPMIMETDINNSSDAHGKDQIERSNAMVKKNALSLLGKSCDEVTMMMDGSTMQMYFPTSKAITPELFSDKEMGKQEEVARSTGMIPYKMTIQRQDFSMTNTAQQVIPMALPASTFELPAGVQIMKMPAGMSMPGGYGPGDGHKH